MLTNRPQVMADYARAGVALSISGHAHWGQELNFDRGVGYFTCPALCEAPYRYAIVTLRGRQVDAKVHSLQMPASPPVVDVHVHTEFAYCGREIAAERMIARAREMGLAGVVLAEHVPQLYEPAEDFWTGKHVRSPGLWRSGQGWRIDAYRAAMDRLRRDPYVKIGLEVELDADGHLVLRDEDRDWADVLVGALHFVSRESKTLTDAELTAEFLRFTEPLVHSGVDVLAHPLRVFSWIQRPTPPELLAPLAQLLADNGVAAEINFHLNYPEDEFFAQCIARGVKIAFGSDSHELAEVGNLGANLAMVQRLAGRQDVTDLLYYP
jgi:histidinol phosphatase-like PHP family hydrolase